MTARRSLRFSSRSARFQYYLLMGLFRCAIRRGFYGSFARGLGHLFGPENAVYLTQGNEPPFKIYLNDGYWTRFALYHHDYEPEVEQVLLAAAGHADVFCDLGANKGYWSVRAAPRYARVVAVEASQNTFELLRENTAKLPNVMRHKRAIHRTTGDVLNFLNVPLSHASARLAEVSDGADESVETISIDDLLPARTSALIKLDVEGAEIAAFDGAVRSLADGSVFIYEDHGEDRDCLPSAHLLKNPEICVYSTTNTPKRLSSIDDIRALKTDRFKGYNFLAGHRSSPLLKAILEDFAKSNRSRYQ